MIKLSIATTRPKNEWLDLFGDRLMQLTPGMNAVEAARRAVTAYASAPDADPTDAAAADAAVLRGRR